MKSFMDEDFLLDSQTAKQLYHGFAEKYPIIDYHCHLSPREIAEDKSFSNITEVWLYGDHYKWRAMRQCGIDEKYVTGNASDFEKFRAYCECMPKLAGNPLYHWSHLELRRYFDCGLIINPENCEKIWRITSEKLSDGSMSAKQLIKNSGVKLLCTTDDPADSLEYHKAIAESGYEVKILPAFRPDKLMNIERRGISGYIKKLGDANGVEITDLSTLLEAIDISLARFESLGCRTADHGMDNYVMYVRPDEYHANNSFKKALETDGKEITESDLAVFKTEILRHLGKYYKSHGWVMQIHYGVFRNPNDTMFSKLGADSGYDMIYGQSCTAELSRLLNYLETENALPRTVLYSVNPADNQAIGTLCGSFCRGDGSGIPTVVQGSAWWFNDNIPGMRDQITYYASLASIGHFPGMLTDSRSFLSYPRHEYFRRIFCGWLGGLVENGEYPYDEKALGEMIRGVCFENTNRLFGFGLENEI